MTVFADEKKFSTRRMVLTAVFCAMAYAVEYVFHFKVGFLTFDAKDAILTLGAMFLGPITGAVMAILVALIEMISMSETAFWGFLMNAVSSAVFAATASAIYQRRKSVNSALIGLLTSVLTTTAVMMVMNIVITPIYTHSTAAAVIGLIPTLLLPFNLIKTVFNAAMVLILYKPVSTALKQIGVISGKGSYRMNRTSVLILAVGVLLIAVCVVILLVFLNGSFKIGK